jgi:hypothetical protein
MIIYERTNKLECLSLASISSLVQYNKLAQFVNYEENKMGIWSLQSRHFTFFVT